MAARVLLNNPVGRVLKRIYRVFRPDPEVLTQRKLKRIARMVSVPPESPFGRPAIGRK